jgi:metal-responsive CopG/Arc/MetJ family transcriptional regulator
MAIWYDGSMAVKITVTLDEDTAKQLDIMTARQRKAKSAVLRDAIREHYKQSDRMPEAERLRMIAILEDLAKQPPTRPQAEVDHELADIRESRRLGWSRPSDSK